MDNCLASNSETGGVGCDNMTMVIVGLLRGKTRDEWYREVADRVAKNDGPCAPPEYGEHNLGSISHSDAKTHPAEFRGPGVKHQFEDSGDDYDMDLHNNGRGRIIFLGDGTEVLTDGNDEDGGNTDLPSDGDQSAEEEQTRKEREETPGPESHGSTEQANHDTMDIDNSRSPSTTNDHLDHNAASDLPPNAIPETALPDKLVTPSKSGQSQT